MKRLSKKLWLMNLGCKSTIFIFLICCETLVIFHKQSTVLAVDFVEEISSSTCSLTLGLSNWEPYQKISKDGVASGLQVKLIRQITEKVGCDIAFKSMTFPEGLKELKNGTTDFLVNASPSADREDFAYFSTPYRNEFLLLYATAPYLEKCHSMTLTELIEDGFKLGLQEKLVYGPEMTKIQNTPSLNKKIIYVENNIQHLTLIIDSHLDGIVDDPVVVSYRSTVNVTGKALSSCPIVVSSSPVSLIFSKKTVPLELVNRFNHVIAKLKKTEQYQKKWSWK